MTVSARGRWLALIAALLGWMFDGLEMGLFPLTARDALAELHGVAKSDPIVDEWYGLVTAAFLIGAASGGVLFGWLGDKYGRVRAMMASVLLYSLCSGISAFSATPWQLAALRFLGALGMGGEWALGVALVMELWPDKSRVWLASVMGACGNFGFTICGTIALAINHNNGALNAALLSLGMPPNTMASLTGHGFWRLLMLLGTLPAVLVFAIRIFVPESERWQGERHSGRVAHWSAGDLLGVLLGSLAAIGVVVLWGIRVEMWIRIPISLLGLALVALGYLYPVKRYLNRLGINAEGRRHVFRRIALAAGLSGVPLIGTWSAVMWMYLWTGKLTGDRDPDARPIVQIASSLGAVLGGFLGPWFCDRFGRRIMYAVLCVSSIITIVGFYQINTAYNTTFIISAFLMGLSTAAFYGWLTLYLPEIFPTSVRATGQGFGFNFGRILAAAGLLQMSALLSYFNNDYSKACAVVPVVYVIGLILIAVAPETKGKPLPD